MKINKDLCKVVSMNNILAIANTPAAKREEQEMFARFSVEEVARVRPRSYRKQSGFKRFCKRLAGFVCKVGIFLAVAVGIYLTSIIAVIVCGG